MKRDLPSGGMNSAAQSLLEEALGKLSIEDLVDVVIHGNEYQRRAAMVCLEGFKDRLVQEHIELLVWVQKLGITESDCSGRCRSLVLSIAHRLSHPPETELAAAAEAAV